jgi:hypothetical protein
MINIPRQTSEEFHTRETHRLTNKVNFCMAYTKSDVEKQALKHAKSTHKTTLKSYYGSKYRKKLLNLPDSAYQIS